MATLSAAALVDDSYVVEAVYTQGQPRVGDSLFASWYNSIMPYHYRAVHKEDPIPHCPPTFSPFDFHHVPQVRVCLCICTYVAPTSSAK